MLRYLLRLRLFFISFVITCTVGILFLSDETNVRTATRSPGAQEINVPNKKLVFVGIMTTVNFLRTRAVAGVETFLSVLPHGVEYMYFVPEGALARKNFSVPMNVYELKGVDDTYPPQKKALAMFYYMWKIHGNGFDWFVRLDDDAYLNAVELLKLLRSLNPNEPHLIGQGATGRKEEAGSLFLGPGDNYCMGGTGIIFSRKTVAEVAPNVFECANNLRTFHEDIELCRCVKQFSSTNLSCTKSSETKKLFLHNYGGEQAFTGDLEAMQDLNRAITIHPLKKAELFYKIHAYITRLNMRRIHQEMAAVKRDTKAILTLMSGKPASYEDMKRITYVQLLPDGTNFAPWELIADRRIYAAGPQVDFPRRGLDHRSKTGIDAAIFQLVSSMDSLPNLKRRHLKRTIRFRRLHYAYRRYSTLNGVDYILDVVLDYKKIGRKFKKDQKKDFSVRRHSYVRVPFLGLRIWPKFRNQTEVKRKETVNFILPLKGRIDTFSRFLRNWDSTCKVDHVTGTRPCTLTIVFYHDAKASTLDGWNEKTAVEHLTSLYNNRADSPDIRLVTVSDKKFSRGEALEIGAAAAMDDDLLFLIDVDIMVSPEAVDHVRFNTELGKQVWFPITFSEYDPSFAGVDDDESSFGDERGFWRKYGFGIVGIYKKDLVAVGGFDRTISGWGKEDVDLFSRIAGTKSLTAMRAPDPGLVHVFHKINCDPQLAKDQLKMCLGTKAIALASVKRLHELIRSQNVS
ncbi:unnamed protein product [Notodromas monacha]|uniref:Hexosyltransferase n=1 Tax=Notodromas monacha TaxID=399045 RepID=A0A7R9GCP9_9CRUS|nr:unnamed protein product [Notodromas monacha]CAG0916335.1 unnamed protein product [Notodromas monacha]